MSLIITKEDNSVVINLPSTFDVSSSVIEASLRATNSAVSAEEDADRAEAARDAAFASIGVIGLNIADARALVANGEQFGVVEGDYVQLYTRTSSTTQDIIPGASYPTKSRVEKIADAIPDKAGFLLDSGKHFPLALNTTGQMVAGIDMDTGALVAVDDRGQLLTGGRDTIIVQVVDAITIYVIIPAKDPNSTRGIRHTIERRSDVGLNADYWQHYFTHEVQWNGSAWIQGEAIIGSSQTEWALGWVGDSGINLGGRAHGHEVFTAFQVFVDGSPVSIASPATFTGSSVTFLQQSDCFYLDDVEQVFEHMTQVTIDADGWFDLRNTWKTLSSRAVRTWYVMMVGLQRAPLGADPAIDPVRLFNTVYREPLYVLEDLTGEVADVTSQARRYLVSGTDGRYSSEAELFDLSVNGTPYSTTYVSYPETGNNRIKLYFSLVLNSTYTPAVNDVITSRGRFRITTNQV